MIFALKTTSKFESLMNAQVMKLKLIKSVKSVTSCARSFCQGECLKT